MLQIGCHGRISELVELRCIDFIEDYSAIENSSVIFFNNYGPWFTSNCKLNYAAKFDDMVSEVKCCMLYRS